MEDRFFFGMWRVAMWNYMWGYSAAQIELMTADQPFVAYKKDTKSKEIGLGGVAKPNKRDMDETVRRWQEKKKAGKGVNLQRFIDTGEKKQLLPENV